MSDTTHIRIPLAVSVVAGNSSEKLRLCLESLKVALQDFRVELFISENRAPYDVKKLAEPFFPGLTLIQNEKVAGLGACHNQILRKTSAPWLLMLRDDVEVLPQTIRQLIECLERHPQAALATPELFLGSLETKPWQPGCRMPVWLPVGLEIPLCFIFQELGLGDFAESQADSVYHERPLAYARNICLLAKREPFLQARGFDENFCRVLEDVEMAHRLRDQQLVIYQAESAKCIYHDRDSISPELWNEILAGLDSLNKKYSNFFIFTLSSLLQWLLRLILYLKGSLDIPPSIEKEEFYKILLYQKGTSKDFLLLTPVLAALRKRFPQAQITLLGNEPALGVLKKNPNLDELRPLPDFFLTHPLSLLWPSRFKKAHRFLKELSLERWDLFIQFDPLFSWLDEVIPALLGKFSRAKWRLGVDTERRGVFLTHKVKCARRRLIHFSRKYSELTALLGAFPSNFKTQLTITPEEKTAAQNWLQKNKVNEDDFLIGVHVTGEPRFLYQTSWPRENFITLLKQLSERYSVKYLFFSSSDNREANWTHAITDRMSPAPLLVEGDLSFGEQAAFLKRANLLIANDSDILHIALAVNCPTIGIFGPGDFQSYATYGEEADLTAFYRPIDCRPCVNHCCENPLCLKGIPVETVLEVATQKIEVLQGLCRLGSSQNSCSITP